MSMRHIAAFRFIFLWLVLAPALAFAAAVEGGTGIVYGTHHAFSLTAPRGWVLDNQSGAAQGIHAAFYPAGSSWKDSPTVMYANGMDKNPGDTLDSIMRSDMAGFRKQFENLEVKDYPDIAIAGGHKAVVKSFAYKGTRDIIAYIDEPASVTMLVLSSKSDAEADRTYAAFTALVQSYQPTKKT